VPGDRLEEEGADVIEIIRLLAGPRFCPWCAPPRETFADWITDHLPVRVVAALSGYYALVGDVAVPLHQRLHEPDPQPGGAGNARV
jgi:hypothetical protein